MADQELIDQFVAITDAPRHVAEHLLDAYGYDLESAVEFYIESGGVGHGNVTTTTTTRPAATTSPSPLPASAPPRSSPINLTGGDGDGEDIDNEGLAASLGTRHRPHPQPRHRPHPSSSARAAGQAIHDLDWAPVEVDLATSNSGDDMSLGSDSSNDDDVDDEEEGERRRRQSRIRRNRPSGAAVADESLHRLGRRLGINDDELVIDDPRPRNNGTTSTATATRNRQRRMDTHSDDDVDDDEPIPSLPDDVDLEEQRMLLAAITGEVYRGRIPDFATDPRYRPQQLSPGALSREALRKEQDAAYHESLEADRRKAEEAERKAREEQEAEAVERREMERVESEKKEAAAKLERTLTSKEAALPEEPVAGTEGAVEIVVRMPGGSRLSRRFHHHNSLSVRCCSWYCFCVSLTHVLKPRIHRLFLILWMSPIVVLSCYQGRTTY